jgi:quinol monooxygenase YgiN
MTQDNVVLNVQMEALQGHEDELAEQLLALLGPTRSEPGCILYELHRDPENAGKFLFYEIWVDQAALDAHTASPHLVRFREYRAQADPDPVAKSNSTKWRVFSA